MWGPFLRGLDDSVIFCSVIMLVDVKARFSVCFVLCEGGEEGGILRRHVNILGTERREREITSHHILTSSFFFPMPLRPYLVWSSVLPRTVSDASTGATATVSHTEATVTCTVVPGSDGGATITSYTVTCTPDSHTCTWTTGAWQCTVTGLTNGVAHTFQVTATNNAGWRFLSVGPCLTLGTLTYIPLYLLSLSTLY
jgi:hypothetical protein